MSPKIADLIEKPAIGWVKSTESLAHSVANTELSINTLDKKIINGDIVRKLSLLGKVSSFTTGNLAVESTKSVVDNFNSNTSDSIVWMSQISLVKRLADGLINSFIWGDLGQKGHLELIVDDPLLKKLPFNAFLNEPSRSYNFYFRILGVPNGWVDMDRQVYSTIKNYIKEQGLLPEVLTADGNDLQYIEFMKTIFPLFFTFKCRSVTSPNVQFTTKELGNTYNMKFPFPEEMIDQGHTLQIEFLNDTPMIEVIEAYETIYNSILNNANLQNQIDGIIPTMLNFENIRNYFSRFTSKDILHMFSLSIVDDTGVHYFPYDYMIPGAVIEYLYPLQVSKQSFLVLRTETFSNVFITRPQSQISYTYSQGGQLASIQSEFGFQKRDFGKTHKFGLKFSDIAGVIG